MTYQEDSINILGAAFDYAVNGCQIDVTSFLKLFIKSKLTKMIENNNTFLITSIDGVCLAKEVLSLETQTELLSDYFVNPKTFAYYVGVILYKYQKLSQKTFQEISKIFNYTLFLRLYEEFPDYNDSSIILWLKQAYEKLETKLRKQREHSKLSQSELARLSKVSLRSIQLYEQRVNDIDKAQVHTLFKLAKVLNCQIEDLLENPESI